MIPSPLLLSAREGESYLVECRASSTSDLHLWVNGACTERRGSPRRGSSRLQGHEGWRPNPACFHPVYRRTPTCFHPLVTTSIPGLHADKVRRTPGIVILLQGCGTDLHTLIRNSPMNGYATEAIRLARGRQILDDGKTNQYMGRHRCQPPLPRLFSLRSVGHGSGRIQEGMPH